jgi:hypothetical protein
MARMEPGPEEIPRHDVVLATVRDFATHSGSPRVAVLVDRGPDHAAPLVEHDPATGLTVTVGEETVLIPAEALDGVPALPVAHPRLPPATALSVDVIAGEVSGPIGTLPAIAKAVEELASVIGGRTVAMVDVEVRDGEPITIAARAGEPTIVAQGDEHFELPPTS